MRRPHTPGCGTLLAPDPAVPDELRARHHIANLLHALVASVDGKDVGTTVDLVGGARVEVRGHDGSGSGCARSWLTRLWTDPGEYRHELSVLAVAPGTGPGLWCARAGFTRWSLRPVPVVHTLGEWDVLVAAGDDGAWTVHLLTVTRTWTRDG